MIVTPIKLNINEISLHARSKRELYWLLQLDGDVYLLPLEQASHKYIADVLSGKKKMGLQFLIYVVCQEFEFDTNSGSTFKKSQSDQHFSLLQNQNQYR